jgi:hypothetical protein
LCIRGTPGLESQLHNIANRIKDVFLESVFDHAIFTFLVDKHPISEILAKLLAILS